MKFIVSKYLVWTIKSELSSKYTMITDELSRETGHFILTCTPDFQMASSDAGEGFKKIQDYVLLKLKYLIKI